MDKEKQEIPEECACHSTDSNAKSTDKDKLGNILKQMELLLAEQHEECREKLRAPRHGVFKPK